MNVVFDLDGVLFDTAELVRDSYQRAGAVPPGDVLAHENSDWLVKQVGVEHVVEVRRVKNHAYVIGLSLGVLSPPLPPLETLFQLANENVCTHVLSGAPIEARRAVLSRVYAHIPLTEHGTILCGVRTPDKMRYIQVGQYGPCGVYIDDQDKFIDLPPGWSFIHYVGQSSRELYDQVKAHLEV